jgi:hypothetical protein
MESTDEWSSSGRSYAVSVFSDLPTRVGLGRKLEDLTTGSDRVVLAEVFREDSRPLPVISCKVFRHFPAELVARFTYQATADLLSGVVSVDGTGWLTENIARTLALTGRTVLGWSGVEWPVQLAGEMAGESSATLFADVDAERVPFSWLQARLDDGEVEVYTYQDDGAFGLRFELQSRFLLADFTDGEYRLHPEAALPVGSIESTEIVVDSSVENLDHSEHAVLTEVTFRVDGESVLLMAAEPDGPDDWRRYDESVVVLRDPSAADRLDWYPPRPSML